MKNKTESELKHWQTLFSILNDYYSRRYLYSNQITTLQQGTFQDLPKLDRLYLYSNQITTIQQGTFQDLPELDRLYLYSNQITTLQQGTFQDLPKLDRLYLDGNQLTTIQQGAFQNLPTLTNLDLSNNDLTVLEENIFQDLTALQTLDLSDNPLTCCELLHLKLFLQNKTLGDAGAMCHGTSIKLIDFNFTDCTAQESDVITTMETTTDTLPSITNPVETSEITTTADNNIPLNTTNSNVGSRYEDDNSAIIAGTVTGALVVLFVIALFVIRKFCCTSADTTLVHPSI
ncbi:Hypothetical predicted protein [Mytilus galloprovincialis]|uniref:LRRCT domain-containing protein n=1 Tax=Mytilus galloprovincialis TaxID=29158 RepID=A0A8B6HC66_MYTGA|nr:Hypothetical predicted protein [Mytilus galloprovincialis]